MTSVVLDRILGGRNGRVGQGRSLEVLRAGQESERRGKADYGGVIPSGDAESNSPCSTGIGSLTFFTFFFAPLMR